MLTLQAGVVERLSSLWFLVMATVHLLAAIGPDGDEGTLRNRTDPSRHIALASLWWLCVIPEHFGKLVELHTGRGVHEYTEGRRRKDIMRQMYLNSRTPQ